MVREIPAHEELRVRSHWVDVNGHLNVQHYFMLAATSVGYWYEDIGLDQRYRVDRRHSIFTQSHHLSYHAEVDLDDQVSVRPRLLGRSASAVHARAFIVNESKDRLACTLEVVFVHVSLDDRSTVSFPLDVATWIDAAMAEQPALDWDPGAGATLWRPRGGLSAANQQRRTR
ncbi:thioesterase [Nocardioides marmoriginsengisoli]|uniref:Thioesterase n=2 Tax=Nocardioides marmoriginsengisoli TaxID=661483 RepID=A0A3N0CPH0_9ACTN|nr:thioesterase [Nocardioides marmoriginsengisoli]